MKSNKQKIITFFFALAILVSPLLLSHSRQSPPVKNPVSGEENMPIANKTPPSDPKATASPLLLKPPSKQSSQPISPSNEPIPALAKDISQGAIKEEDRILTKDGQVFPIHQYKPLLTPNDTYANQWWVAPNGMNAVWDIPAGSQATKIAVIDTGYALEHQEFAGRFATNGGESGAASAQGPSKLNCADQGLALNKSCNNIDDNFDGIIDNETGVATRQNPSRLNCTDQGLAVDKQCNRLDDDNNGYVDDWRGFDFANFDSFVQAGETNPSGSGTTHGTMVASVLGATGNNGVGIAGVNWHTSILPIQALNDDGYGDTYTVAEAIYYAADQNVDVISVSLGGTYEDNYLRFAINYALSRGAIVVAASGNDGCNCISYPANFPEVIAVGAVDNTNNPAGFSNYGANLDFLAPGSSMTTAYWTQAEPADAYAGGASGTSFATPFVSGMLGLARSHQPSATWEEITGAMFENSDRRSLTATSPRNETLGYGVSRANAMLARVLTPAQPGIRYQFAGAPVLGSARSYQCENTVPASTFFELSKPGQLRYTASVYQNYNATQQGWASREVMPTCIGLPTDTPNVLRLINLPSETGHIYPKY